MDSAYKFIIFLCFAVFFIPPVFRLVMLVFREEPTATGTPPVQNPGDLASWREKKKFWYLFSWLGFLLASIVCGAILLFAPPAKGMTPQQVQYQRYATITGMIGDIKTLGEADRQADQFREQFKELKVLLGFDEWKTLKDELIAELGKVNVKLDNQVQNNYDVLGILANYAEDLDNTHAQKAKINEILARIAERYADMTSAASASHATR